MHLGDLLIMCLVEIPPQCSETGPCEQTTECETEEHTKSSKHNALAHETKDNGLSLKRETQKKS